MNATQRREWASLSDDELLRQCEVDTYRASGPGGQKRNKTSSAVRLRHPQSGLMVIAEESRSQHDNRAKALKRLRQAFYLKIRLPLAAEQLTPEQIDSLEEYHQVRDGQGRLKIGRKDARFWPVVGIVLDVLDAVEAKVSDAAQLLTITTSNLISFAGTDSNVWEQVAHLRTKHGQKPLRLP